MPNLQIIINNKIATYVKRSGAVVCGNSDYVAEFAFDQEWDTHESKIARFTWGGKYVDMPITGSTCQVPILYDTDTLTVGVYAGNLCTTTPAMIPCQRSILCGTDIEHPEAEDLQISEALKAAAEAQAAAAAVADCTKKGEGSVVVSRAAVALGENTTAGSRGFRITEYSDNAMTDYFDGPAPIYVYFTLDGYTGGYAVGDVVTVRLNSYYDRYGTIVKITKNEIHVEPFGTYLSERLVSDPTDDQNTLRVPDKPEIGRVDIGTHAVAVGLETRATGPYANAEGFGTKADGKHSHAEGNQTEAVYASHAEGRETKALGQTSHAEGWKTEATGNYTHAEGHTTKATKDNAHAEGWNTTASGECSHAEGNETEASGTRSHAEGYGAKAAGHFAHAEGKRTTANGESSHAEGDGTQATARATHAEGVNTIASAQMAHAEGYNTRATGEMAHAEGANTTASGKRSHAEGNGTTADGDRAHAEGETTTASGNAAHSEGNHTQAMGAASHAGGLYTVAASNYQTVLGKYNVEDTEGKYAFIIGNGTAENARSNAVAVRWDGTLELAGVAITPAQITQLLALIS